MKYLQTVALCFCLTLGAVSAAPLDEINQLVTRGENTQALNRLNSYIADHPDDSQAQFLKGIVFSNQGQAQQAIEVFTALTENYPELPEPYNNLAVIYSKQGELDKARLALERAVDANPNFAIAHENLGDVYAEMASRSYAKAAELDNANATAKIKLTLARELLSGAKASQPRPVNGGKTPAP